ncbi:MAG: penicillin-binding protein 2 [Lentisphaeria bacterium]|nr:penicillin-binding protein 2 [Lentisphaeria bacterium]
MDQLTNSKQKIRILVIIGIAIVLTMIIGGRLYSLQISQQSKYRDKIVKQSIRKIRIPGQRGKIFASDLQILADTKPEVNLLLYVNEIKLGSRNKNINHISMLLNEMAFLLNRENNITEKDVRRHLIQTPGLPMVAFKNLNSRELVIAYEKTANQEAWALEVDSFRSYPGKETASHIIGYVGKEDASKAEDKKEYSYYISDMIGREGLEKSFDTIAPKNNPNKIRGLRGEAGYSIVQVDNLGYVRKNIIHEVAPINGNHIVLTIDMKAQNIAEKLLQNQNGGLILLNAENGDILASVSRPSYNLDYFSPRVNGEYYRLLRQNRQAPLLNKVTNGLFSPGSILKPLVGLAILESGVDPESTITCDGSTKIGNAKINCAAHRYGGHGTVNLYQALERSCNDYFIEHGLKLGREKLYNMFKSANLGQPTRLEIPTAKGILPTEEYKKRVFGGRWTEFDTGLISIGQGIITISPLQAALYAAAFANGGKIYQPHLVNRVLDHNGNILQERKVEFLSELACSSQNLEAVKNGMFDVVNAPRGSGRQAKVKELEIFGKTGTAEIGSRENRRQNTWFIAFLTYEGRSYALAIIIEDGISGGSSCAPLVAEFFRQYLLDKKTEAK